MVTMVIVRSLLTSARDRVIYDTINIATRYDKLKRNYESMVALACGFMWLPM